ncbi:MAG: hypothetical protein ABSG57_01665 [Candidatus Bathyarchaeia archaeon]
MRAKKTNTLVQQVYYALDTELLSFMSAEPCHVLCKLCGSLANIEQGAGVSFGG